MKSITLLLALLLAGCGQEAQFENTPSTPNQDQFQDTNTVIYGEDNRLDFYGANDKWQEIANSTVALMQSHSLRQMGNGDYQIRGKSYASEYGLCREEPFYEQDIAAFCSGSLVAPDIVMTAGHCISTCNGTKFVFDFHVKAQGALPSRVGRDDVYSCSKVIVSKVQGDGADFALVKLDRPVVGRRVLPIENSEPRVNEDLVVVGYPAGLPVKVAAGASVRSIRSSFFVANLDTYGGNSGSAVFNENGEIRGILVRGETDYVRRGSCSVSNRCPESGCRGEDVTKVTQVTPFLQ